jgi:hypothetical protein
MLERDGITRSSCGALKFHISEGGKAPSFRDRLRSFQHSLVSFCGKKNRRVRQQVLLTNSSRLEIATFLCARDRALN